MPLQPSFRSLKAKSRQSKPTGSTQSRGSKSEKVAAGSFRQSVQDVLDDDGTSRIPPPVNPPTSVPERSRNREQASEDDGIDDDNEVVPRRKEKGASEGYTSSRRRASPRGSGGSRQQEMPPAKRTYSDDNVSKPSFSAKGVQASWTFNHTKSGSVIKDAWGMGTLMGHMKQPCSTFPALKELAHKDAFLDVAYHLGQLANAMNQAIIKYESQFKEFPDAKELEDVRSLFQETKDQLDQVKAEAKESQLLVGQLKSEVADLSGRNGNLSLELKVKTNKIGSLESFKKSAEAQVKELMVINRELTANQEAEIKRAKRAGKREIVSAYQKVLNVVKDKFQRKKKEVSYQIHAQEIHVNIELLTGLLTSEIKSAQAEHNRLMALLPPATATYEKSQVSDFSVSKLSLPQVSDSGGVSEGENLETGAPVNEHGSNDKVMDIGTSEIVRQEIAKDMGSLDDENPDDDGEA